jgi:very-short-patch-repair endonuclease
VSDFFGGFFRGAADLPSSPRAPLKLSARTLGSAVEAVLMAYTRRDLEVVLAQELELAWVHEDSPSDQDSKRSLIQAYTAGWALPQLVGLARRIVTELDRPEADLQELKDLVALYDAGGGVAGPTKNLIFAANGPKPDIVLRDAMSNDIEIVANAEYCLVYDQPIPAEGLRFSHLVKWWREQERLPESMSEQDVGRALHARLAASLDNNAAERVVFDVYASRYRKSFDIPALIPQVYLHYDPYDQRVRRSSSAGVPLTRQRMDFLLLFSDRRRVVVEVDGKQHYANGDRADPGLYAQMVAEDRRLRLAGYEVYRFGGAELFGNGSKAMVEKFFDDLAERMK